MGILVEAVVESNHDAEIEARLKVIAARARRALTADELGLVRERIARDVANREEMRTLPLATSDTPDSSFNPRVVLDGGLAW